VSLLVGVSHLAASDLVAPYLLNLGPASPSSSPNASAAAKQKQKQTKERAALERARARMEASYEVLGSGLDAHSEGSTASGGEEMEAEEGNDVVNGEEVRFEVEAFLKKQMVRSAVAGLGFLLSVVGIWGDGVSPVYGQAVVIEV
jgi:autophagy-related protein 33